MSVETRGYYGESGTMGSPEDQKTSERRSKTLPHVFLINPIITTRSMTHHHTEEEEYIVKSDYYTETTAPNRFGNKIENRRMYTLREITDESGKQPLKSADLSRNNEGRILEITADYVKDAQGNNTEEIFYVGKFVKPEAATLN